MPSSQLPSRSSPSISASGLPVFYFIRVIFVGASNPNPNPTPTCAQPDPEWPVNINVHTPQQQQRHRSAVLADAVNPSPTVPDQNLPIFIMPPPKRLNTFTNTITSDPLAQTRTTPHSLPVIDSDYQPKPNQLHRIKPKSPFGETKSSSSPGRRSSLRIVSGSIAPRRHRLPLGALVCDQGWVVGRILITSSCFTSTFHRHCYCFCPGQRA
jgi:hypothetical protein